MNGTDVVFDTNALINFFNGHPGLQQHARSNVILSIVNVLEFLSYPRITKADEILLAGFLKKVELVNLEIGNTILIQQAVAIRKAHRIKLPDAIVAATALLKQAELIANDGDFRKVPNLKIKGY